MQSYTANGNGIYVQINNWGQIMVSADGVTWPTYTWPQKAPAPFRAIDAHWVYNGITFGAGHFVAFGNHIVIVSAVNAYRPAGEWFSTLMVGGNWLSATFTGTNWVLVDDEGRTVASSGVYPGDWGPISAATSPGAPNPDLNNLTYEDF